LIVIRVWSPKLTTPDKTTDESFLHLLNIHTEKTRIFYRCREISKEDFDMDISNMQQELDNLKVPNFKQMNPLGKSFVPSV